jgi:hypothetical protein
MQVDEHGTLSLLESDGKTFFLTRMLKNNLLEAEEIVKNSEESFREAEASASEAEASARLNCAPAARQFRKEIRAGPCFARARKFSENSL